MEVGDIVPWRRAALDEMEPCPFFYNDKGVLELPCPRRVQPEVGLQRNLHLHALWHIDKGAA